MSTATIAGARPRPVDPAAAVAGTRARTSPAETVSQTLSMAWRALKTMRRNPEQFFDVTLQPLLFTAMFAFVFGGAISGDVASYLPLMIPGIVAQTVLTTCMATGVQLREDMDKGVFDRFKSLPIARIAPLAGPMVADLVRYLIAASLTFAMGMVLGYRPGGGVLGVAAAIVLAVFTGWAIAWIFTWVGTIARSARSVQGISMMILFPLTFLSNAFVPVDTLPSRAADVREHQPGLPPGLRDARPRQQRHGHHPGRLDAARRLRRDGDLRAARGAQLQAPPLAGKPLDQAVRLVEQLRRPPVAELVAQRGDPAGGARLGVRRDPLPRHRRDHPVVGEALGEDEQLDRVVDGRRVAQQAPGAEREQRQAGDGVVEMRVRRVEHAQDALAAGRRTAARA